MPACNETFPWMSYYENYNYFENRISSHNKVSNIRNTGEGIYEIDLANKNTIRVFICECYSFGLAEYYESVEILGEINAVIINSMWCGYTLEAKHYCLEHSVGLFDISGFMAALSMNNFWEYMTKDEKENLINNGQY